MFKCENAGCGKLVKSGQPANRIITEKREKVYSKPIRKRKGGRIVDYKDVFGSEIVKEIKVCPKCFRELTGTEPRMISEEKKPIPRRYKGFNAPLPRRKKWQNPRAKKPDFGSPRQDGQGSVIQQSSDTTKTTVKKSKKPIVEIVKPLSTKE
jgi:hypothetical protein